MGKQMTESHLLLRRCNAAKSEGFIFKNVVIGTSMFRQDVLLYAEDDSGFADLLHCTMKKAGFAHQLIHVTDGEQAIAYLKGDGKYADRQAFPLPLVALLDLKMPRVNGFEVLQWIRKKSAYPYLPVVVLTSSDELRDVNEAYRLGANSFLVKPPSADDLKAMLTMLDEYWFQQNVTVESFRRDLSP